MNARNADGSAEHQLGMDGKSKRAKLGLGAPIGAPKGWYSRGYVPHCDVPGQIQSITFRLADSLPQEKLLELEAELAKLAESQRDDARRQKIEQWLDSGMGCCALKHPEMARVMVETLLKFDGLRYRLLAWCVMPNHVHVLIEPAVSLSKIVQSWKSYTGRWALANDERLGLGIGGNAKPQLGMIHSKAELGLGAPGTLGVFWMREYWDRFIRNERHLNATLEYIHQNPVKAGLCVAARDWAWSSACWTTDAELGLGVPRGGL